jgi:hypothetical protein
VPDLDDGVRADDQVRAYLLEHLQQAEDLPVLGDPGRQPLVAQFGAVPTLTAAATVTQRVRLGTLVTSVKPRSRITG